MSSDHKHFTFLKDNCDPLTIDIHEDLDGDYAMFTWPSAVVMAQFIWYHSDMFEGKTVLELGAGTSLPSIIAAKIGARVIASDKLNDRSRKLCLKNITWNNVPVIDLDSRVDEGSISNQASLPEPGTVAIRSILWGDFQTLFQLPSIDVILASDCFYDEKYFEDIIATVSFLMRTKSRSNAHGDTCSLKEFQSPSCKSPFNPESLKRSLDPCNGMSFYTTYQRRKVDFNIDCLLEKWDLRCHERIPLNGFEASSHQLLGSTTLPGNCTIDLFHYKKKEEERRTCSMTASPTSNCSSNEKGRMQLS